MIKGSATKEGIENIINRNIQIKYVQLGNTPLKISQAGFGSYRVDISIESHHRALEKALTNGINLIDTSANYSDGGSEQLIGHVLNKLIGEGKISRSQIVIVSKVGYLQGQNYILSQKRLQEGNPFQDLVTYSQELEHCIHPEFIEDQITRSLQRLDVEKLDVYLLHNPEYYLSWAHKNGLPLDIARKEYYHRIEKAFNQLETEVQNGRIQYYGISSNTFPKSEEQYDFTSLETIWQIANNISKDHHFRVIQFPMNLFERGAVIEANQSNSQSLIEFAMANNIATLINRPLNAIVQNSMIRLADVEPEKPVSDDKIIKYIEDLLESEKKFSDSLVYSINVEENIRNQYIEYLCPGFTLKKHWKDFSNYTQWYNVLTQHISPRFNMAITALSETNPPIPVTYWMENHVDQIQRVFRSIDSYYKQTASELANKIKKIVMGIDEDWESADNLSQLAIRTMRSTEGITSVLVGMRDELYVNDVFYEIRKPLEIKDRMNSWKKMDKDLIPGYI